MSTPRYPSPCQINTRAWLTDLSRKLERVGTLDDIPASIMVWATYGPPMFSGPPKR